MTFVAAESTIILRSSTDGAEDGTDIFDADCRRIDVSVIVGSEWKARRDVDVDEKNGSNRVTVFDNIGGVLLQQWCGRVTCWKIKSAALIQLFCFFSVDDIVVAAPIVTHRDDLGDIVAILMATNVFPICVDVGVTLNVATDLFSDVVAKDENDNSVLLFELNDVELICDTADAVEPFEWNDDKIDCVLGDEWPIASANGCDLLVFSLM